MGRGTVLVPSDFLDLGSRRAVDLALHRLVKKGILRRLARGLYDYAKTHPTMGVLSPSPDAVAKAIAGKDRIRLQPFGAYAANLLRLSEQVPARIVFLTDGPSRKVKVARQTIELRRTTPRNMAAAGKTSGLSTAAFISISNVRRANAIVSRIAPWTCGMQRKEYASWTRSQFLCEARIWLPSTMRRRLAAVFN